VSIFPSQKKANTACYVFTEYSNIEVPELYSGIIEINGEVQDVKAIGTCVARGEDDIASFITKTNKLIRDY